TGHGRGAGPAENADGAPRPAARPVARRIASVPLPAAAGSPGAPGTVRARSPLPGGWPDGLRVDGRQLSRLAGRVALVTGGHVSRPGRRGAAWGDLRGTRGLTRPSRCPAPLPPCR